MKRKNIRKEGVWKAYSPRIHSEKEIDKWVSKIDSFHKIDELKYRGSVNAGFAVISAILIGILSFFLLYGWWMILLPVPEITKFSMNEWHFAGIAFGVIGTIITIWIFIPIVTLFGRIVINGTKYYHRYELEIELRKRKVK